MGVHRRFPGKSVDEACAEARDAEVATEVDRLGGLLFASVGASSSWNAQRLAMAVKTWRKERTGVFEHKAALAKLNP